MIYPQSSGSVLSQPPPLVTPYVLTWYIDLTSDEVESTASLTNSIRDFRNMNGRTYGNSKTTDYW